MDEKYMKIALKEAKKAYLKNEVPVGAVIVKNGEIISKAHNQKVSTKNIFGHAEILAIKKAANRIGDWRLNECVMYVTLEPCPMCASAIQQSRIKKVYIGASSKVENNKDIIQSIFQNPQFNHIVDVEYNCDDNCSQILTDFFCDKR